MEAMIRVIPLDDYDAGFSLFAANEKASGLDRFRVPRDEHGSMELPLHLVEQWLKARASYVDATEAIELAVSQVYRKRDADA